MPAHEDSATRGVKYRQIADDLRRAIEAGDLAAGERIPPARALAEQYEVTSATVQAALQILKEERYIEGRQGLGTFVTPAEVWQMAAKFRLPQWSPDPAKKPLAVEEGRVEADLEEFAKYRALAAEDPDFADRFARTTRAFVAVLRMEFGYWNLERLQEVTARRDLDDPGREISRSPLDDRLKGPQV